MMWLSPVDLEPVTVVDDGTVLQMGVSEHAPSSQAGTPGQTMQRFQLLLPTRERLTPPTRLQVRGLELRVLGTQVAPWPDAPSIVTCELVNPDLPDDAQLIRTGDEVLDDTTGRFIAAETVLWSGGVHINSGVPATVEAAGVDAPLDKVTITMPLIAPYEAGLIVRVTSGRTPGVGGVDYRISGEVLDSSAALRRVVAYRFRG